MTGMNKNKSGIFLMELMVVILFLSLALTICVKVFVAGEKLSEKSYALTNVAIEAENVSQILKAEQGDVAFLQKYYQGKTVSDGMVLFFTKEFEPCLSEEHPKYEMKISQSKTKCGVIISKISCYEIKSEKEIFALTTQVLSQKDGDV